MITWNPARTWIILGLVTLIGKISLNLINPVSAQVVADDTLAVGERSQVSGNPIFQIDGGAVRGGNLFHSFSQLSLTNGQTAFFNNPTSITNIITRVTGGTLSNIDGIIRANGSANLFLINPSGIIFGPNAQLNIGGSFLATTASGIQFDNQGIFNAITPDVPGLLTINPSALLFNQIAAQPIIHRSIFNVNGLQVNPKKSLLLIGGNVELDGGRIQAPGGRVELGGISSQGVIGLSTGNDEWRSTFPENTERADVSLSNGAQINVLAAGGGSISVYARNLTMAGTNTSFRAGIDKGMGTVNTRAGDIQMNVTETVRLNSSLIFNQVQPEGIGNSGNISITSGSLLMTGQAEISTATFGRGSAGNVFINTRDRVSLDGVDPIRRLASIISSSARVSPGARPEETVGNAGDILITTGSLSLTNGASLVAQTNAIGNAGDITIYARDSVLISGISQARLPIQSGLKAFVQDTGVGDGGNITITTGSLFVTSGGSLASQVLGRGNAGNITITARDTVVFDGVNRGFISSASTNVNTPATLLGVLDNIPANGGNITISAKNVSFTNGAILTARIFNRPGRAGSITVVATDTVNLSGVSNVNNQASGLFTSTETLSTPTTGSAGTISVTSNNLQISAGAVLSARSLSEGQGGSINVNVNRLNLLNGGQILTTAFRSGDAGEINVNAVDRIVIANQDPTFAARLLENGPIDTDTISAFSGMFANTDETSTGRGGSVTVHTGQLLLQDSGQIAVSSQGSGDAGNLNITARSIQLNDQAKLTAETANNQGGNITLNLQDLLLLRRSSLISATAGTDQAGGDGGNITINAPNGFIVAVPNENSDIRANAFTGRGGNVTITAQGIYGIEFQPKDTPLSDITASSQFGLSGTVSIRTPNIDPNQSEIELPNGFVDTDALIANSCIAQRDSKQGSFVVTGAGGLPTMPDDLASVPFPTYSPPDNRQSAVRNSNSELTPYSLVQPEIAEIDGIYQLSNGEMVLGRSCW